MFTFSANLDTLLPKLPFADRFAAAAQRMDGLRLLMASIKTFEVPGFFASHAAQALDLMDEVRRHPSGRPL